MSVSETVRLIVLARRAGVTLTARADGKLGWKAAQRPPDALMAVLERHKADILALLPPPRSELAKLMIWRLRSLGFCPYLNDEGVLLIADAHATGKKRRHVSQYLPIARVFDEIVAGSAWGSIKPEGRIFMQRGSRRPRQEALMEIKDSERSQAESTPWLTPLRRPPRPHG